MVAVPLVVGIELVLVLLPGAVTVSVRITGWLEGSSPVAVIGTWYVPGFALDEAEILNTPLYGGSFIAPVPESVMPIAWKELLFDTVTAVPHFVPLARETE